MKRLLIFANVIMLAVFLVYTYLPYYPTQLRSPDEEPLPTHEITHSTQVSDLIDTINAHNEEIRSLSCDDIRVHVSQGGIKLRLKAEVTYQKPRFFRMVTKSLVGTELDIGSNNDLFWFWSRRMRPPILYYADHRDFYKTRMKTPFNPMFMMETLGLGKIDVTDAKAVEARDKYVVIRLAKNSIGQPIALFTYLNKQTARIDGIAVVNADGKLSASGEVLSWRNDAPSQILYVWAEERTSMLLDLPNVTLNGVIDSTKFDLPNISPRQDMSKDVAFWGG